MIYRFIWTETQHHYVRTTLLQRQCLSWGRWHCGVLVFGQVCVSTKIPTLELICFWSYVRWDFLSKEDLEQMDVIWDLFLGPPEEMTLSEPIADPNKLGCLIRGTAFEWCGQHLVKGSGCCYSLTIMHQCQHALVGPTAALKQIEYAINDDDDDDVFSSLNLEIWGKVVKVSKVQLVPDSLKTKFNTRLMLIWQWWHSSWALQMTTCVF